MTHSSDACLNCYIKFPFLRHNLFQIVGRYLLKEKPFFCSFRFMCRPIDMMTVSNLVRSDVHE